MKAINALNAKYAIRFSSRAGYTRGSRIGLIVQSIIRKVFILSSLFDRRLYRRPVVVFMKKGRELLSLYISKSSHFDV